MCAGERTVFSVSLVFFVVVIVVANQMVCLQQDASCMRLVYIAKGNKIFSLVQHA